MIRLLNCLAHLYSGSVLGKRFVVAYTPSFVGRNSANLVWNNRGLYTASNVLTSTNSCRRHLMVDGESTLEVGSDEDEFHNWLVVGDGDLSYSSMLADELSRQSSNYRLVATVLEEEKVHNQVYERSENNAQSISSHSLHKVKFGIDGTELLSYFPTRRFDIIEFNFPHWKGKTNAKWNRELIDKFLKSASSVLKRSGEIRIAFCHGQGGLPADTLEDWKTSWLPAMYAAEHGLILSHFEPYQPTYGLSSHRGVDRPFFLGKNPQKYYFRFPNGDAVSEEVQLSCRHELRIMLHQEKLATCPVPFHEIVNGEAVFMLGQEFIPDGVRFEIPARHLLTPYEALDQHVPLAVFLLNYSGERIPLTRSDADQIRDVIEKEITRQWGLEIAKGGRLVSRPYPYPLLSSLIKEY